MHLFVLYRPENDPEIGDGGGDKQKLTWIDWHVRIMYNGQTVQALGPHCLPLVLRLRELRGRPVDNLPDAKVKQS